MQPTEKTKSSLNDCPVMRTAQLLDGKWTILILRDLLRGPKRYFELQQSLAGISARILAARLKVLTTRGIVLRTVFQTTPPSTEYTLTPTGSEVIPVIKALATFGTRLHIPFCEVNCPVHRTAHILDGKWSILLLRDLLAAPKRFGQLQQSLSGISPRLLAARLKALKGYGIVERLALANEPITSEYVLTAQGSELYAVIDAMKDLGITLLAQDRMLQTKVNMTPNLPSDITVVRNGKRVAG